MVVLDEASYVILEILSASPVGLSIRKIFKHNRNEEDERAVRKKTRNLINLGFVERSGRTRNTLHTITDSGRQYMMSPRDLDELEEETTEDSEEEPPVDSEEMQEEEPKKQAPKQKRMVYEDLVCECGEKLIRLRIRDGGVINLYTCEKCEAFYKVEIKLIKLVEE